MNTDRVSFFAPAFLLLVALLFTACAAETIRMVGVNYIEGTENTIAKKQEIYVAPILLAAGIKDENYRIGVWERLNKQKDVYVLDEKVTELFARGLNEALKEKGYKGKTAEGWNLKTDELTTFDKNIIALKVEQFETLSYSTAVKVESQFILKVTGHIGIPSENRVYSTTVNLQSTPVDINMSDEKVVKEFSLLYTDAIRQVVNKLLDKQQ